MTTRMIYGPAGILGPYYEMPADGWPWDPDHHKAPPFPNVDWPTLLRKFLVSVKDADQAVALRCCNAAGYYTAEEFEVISKLKAELWPNP
jgi:hypothetical protein